MPSKIRKLAIRIPIAVILILIGWLLFDALRPTPPQPPLPNPNGYDDFVKAGQMLHFDSSVDFRDLNQEELHNLVFTNADALKLMRLGLNRECRVPISFSLTNYDNHALTDLPLIKLLALSLAAEGKLAEMENRQADATKSYLDCIRLGRESVRGGVILDKLVGIACEAIGANAVQRLTDHLSSKECRDTIQQLEKLEANSESAEEILKNEKNWVRRTFGWRERMWTRFVAGKSDRRNEQLAVGKIKKRERATRILMLDLAARAYELENGERPKTINDLVPNYLKTIPLDPFSKTNLTFQP